MSVKPKRVLFVATVVKTHIMTFHIPYLKMFQEMGYETAVAARNDYENPDDCLIPYCNQFFDIPFQREPFHRDNFQCYKKLKTIIDEGEFSIVHCHTPVGGVLGRLAARKARKEGARVMYTAHGFHFYRGAPLKNWILYYPIEKICSYFADAIITINEEDFHFAKRNFTSTSVFNLPGVGINVARFSQEHRRNTVSQDLCGVRGDEKWILSVGELNDNKNQKTIIRALALPGLEKVHYLIAGTGIRRAQLEAYAAELKVNDRVHFLGFRNDIPELLHTADVFVFPSQREGLPVALMEAMAAGVPVVASRIRGNVDLIINGVDGFLCDPSDEKCFADRIGTLLSNDILAKRFSKRGHEKIKEYDIENVLYAARKIYKVVLDK